MSLVTTEHRDGIAILTANNPPVNALGHPLRAALAEAFAALAAETPRAAVLRCAGRTFFAGADVREFGQPPQPPAIYEVAAQIEDLPFPVVAAIHGGAFGGGLELALGCHGRVAEAGAKLGFPEVTLGIIPGAGGVVRSARLLPPRDAVDLITTGKRIDAGEAQRIGLVDRVSEGLLEDAITLARQLADDMPVPISKRDHPEVPSTDFWPAQEADVRRNAKGVEAPLVALDILQRAYAEDFETARRAERAAFERLRDGEQAAALRHVFFAERQAAKTAKGEGAKTIETAGVVGGGTMGAGIATAFLLRGLMVTLAETSGEAANAARERVQKAVGAAVKRGLVQDADVVMARFSVTTEYDAFSDTDLVVEAVFEDLDVKRQVFARLEDAVRSDTILATNTSYLDPREIGDVLRDRSRFIGLHFFSPAQIMKLVEIVPVPETSDASRATAFKLVERLGKVGIRAGICEGFIGNRILKRYRAAAEELVRQGVPVAEIDAAMRDFGLAMGPFQMQDLAGLDIAFLQREAARKAGQDVPDGLSDVLVRAGRKGQKTGGGWYDYREGDRTPHPSEEVARLLASHVRGSADMVRSDIAERLVAEMAEEGAQIVAEGIADDAGQVDLVELHGYGFPRWRGGPLFHAERQGAAEVERVLGRAPAPALAGLLT
ncbi:3-hydroxyacyl-CoA dehydrogenase NAD-binding domain-containing protein [Tranquillimonas alkanivorans]|uniref:Short chain enoyl-CoA hydratase /3-hydroxyacyl-CoA dehydrogenase n=1 Tax=Tranquillimonas alkanivorans TaxID=441119 RepID=A0A1I5S755_9RHOB|nr:3-hydroxyacyl-CoA dehydrogenase NAD-binding domain-containing protein [Tranquillimonas alkanivorans]SFP66511.1 short chain enoyl-CoA hydratase /3-hydroxyacyl-CoA dehydrogenase [Tranquillimonas alkanivorans]